MKGGLLHKLQQQGLRGVVALRSVLSRSSDALAAAFFLFHAPPATLKNNSAAGFGTYLSYRSRGDRVGLQGEANRLIRDDTRGTLCTTGAYFCKS